MVCASMRCVSGEYTNVIAPDVLRHDLTSITRVRIVPLKRGVARQAHGEVVLNRRPQRR